MAGPEVRVRGLDSVMIFSADPGSSSAWWGALFDRPVHEDDAFRWIDVPGGVELGFHPADEAKNPVGASTVVYWNVDSLDAALGRAVAAGGTVHRGPLAVGAGRRIAQVRDPFGSVQGFAGR